MNCLQILQQYFLLKIRNNKEPRVGLCGITEDINKNSFINLSATQMGLFSLFIYHNSYNYKSKCPLVRL